MPKNKLKVKNIKISIVTKQIIKKKSTKNVIVRLKKSHSEEFTVTIYPKSTNLLNVTGIKKFQEIEHVVILVQNYFKCDIKNVRLDCVFYSVKNFGNYNLEKTYQILKKNKLTFAFYNPEDFAGIIVKSCDKKIPLTLLIFRTGSLCILGKVLEKSAQTLYKSIYILLKNLDK